ncbi:MAG TPA: PTS sugar transporter subunit IIA [Acidobacteriota bacterium]|nr:PTS sugar transporter subunit IIA [Acidobacteriota bacterium]
MLVDPNPLLTLAIVLVAGVASGAIARRVHLPAVTGQIVVGILLGPWAFSVFEHAAIEELQPVTHFALGLIGVMVGNHLHLRRLRNAFRRLTLLVIAESLITPLLVFLVVFVFPQSSWTLALLLATLAISTAPATIIAIIKETRSKGVFVRTLMPAVALNNIACIALFELAFVAAKTSFDPTVGHSLLGILIAPFRELLAAAVLGGTAGAALIGATWRIVRPDRLATVSMIAILFTAGLADYLGISALLSCMFLGVALANFTPEREEIGHGVFVNFETAIFAAFFTLAGMALDFRYLVPGGLLAVGMVIARGAGKVIAGRVAMQLAGATERIRKYLGLALVPQAGVAVGLILLVQGDPAFEPIRNLFLAVGLSAVTLSEIIGPILTRHALQRSGDFGKDRARLIDFLHEENITTDLEALTKEEAIERLTDLMIQSHHVRVDRDVLLRSILEREREGSTCVGGGLAIPHGALDEGASIVGVMGISRPGLRFETPDGIPVHCMVLLATPHSERNRHLEVLASLARAIVADPNIQLQLFNAKSPAHAYEILHAEEFEDYNYFLDEDVAP